MASRPAKWRILAVFGGLDLDASEGGPDQSIGALQELADLIGSSAEMLILRDKTLDEVSAQMQAWRPNMLFFSSGALPKNTEGRRTLMEFTLKDDQGGDVPVNPDMLASLCEGQEIDAVYIQAFATARHARVLREIGVAHVVYWEPSLTPAPLALHVSHFGHTFFATLRNSSATIPEAFALAVHSSHAHCGSTPGVQQRPSWRPELFSDFDPLLPSIDSVPLPVVKGANFKNGVAAAVPGWENVRLLAPHAELRLLVCGQASLIDAHRLSYLGEALRALLVLEVRQLVLSQHQPCGRTPAHLPNGATATRCSVRSASNAHASVVLGGPPQVLASDSLVEYALRQTLVADSLSLQFRLPPPGTPAPLARRSDSVAGGSSAVDALVVTSVWAVHILRSLSQDSTYRGLVSLGFGGIGSARVAGFNTKDGARYSSLATSFESAGPIKVGQLLQFPAGMPVASGPSAPSGPGSYPTMLAPRRPGEQHVSGATAQADGNAQPGAANGHAAEPAGEPAAATGSGQKRKRSAAAAGAGDWKSARPRMAECTEAQFMEDLCKFHRERLGKKASPDSFPDAILNGTRLDLYNLYMEVTSRGGFRVGNGINWKGQVFPKMDNYTAHNRMTGVGNALKRHYMMYLLEYEEAHPQDVTSSTCSICGGSDEKATDWISCDSCDKWVHFSCDKRPDLGAFKDYVKGNGRTYECPSCEKPAAVGSSKPLII